MRENHRHLSVVTWNLDGLDDAQIDPRTEAACLALLLRDDPPDVVLLQEVVDRSLVAHIRPWFSHSGYTGAVQPPTGEYFCAVFVRQPWTMTGAVLHPFPGSLQGRALLEVEVAHEGRTLRIGTAHLESGPEARAQRIAQATHAVSRLHDFEGPALFGGDTNLRKAELAEIAGMDRVVDAFESMGSPVEHHTTWYPRGQARRRTVGARFDRVWLNDHPAWSVVDVRTLGAEPVDAARGMRISDHLGLEVSLMLVG